jgi:hypothetical protein
VPIDTQIHLFGEIKNEIKTDKFRKRIRPLQVRFFYFFFVFAFAFGFALAFAIRNDAPNMY